MENIFSALNNFTFDPKSLEAFSPEISATLQNIFDKLNTNPALSALNALSGVPLHPYDQLKYNIYGPEYKDIEFKTLEDVPEPESFKPEEVVLAVTGKIQNMQKTLLENADRPPHLFTNTVLNTISGENIIPDIDKYKKHIDFIELIKQMPSVSELNNEQIMSYAKKVVSEFVKSY
jgi:hypothetical protein